MALLPPAAHRGHRPDGSQFSVCGLLVALLLLASQCGTVDAAKRKKRKAREILALTGVRSRRRSKRGWAPPWPPLPLVRKPAGSHRHAAPPAPTLLRQGPTRRRSGIWD